MKPLRSVRLQADQASPAEAGRYVLAIVLALSVSACAVRAPYKAPTVPPTTMKNADSSLVSEEAFDPRWWGQFEDPVLDELVARALAANHDVRIAVARLDQARAIFDDVKLDRYPTVTAGASVDRRSELLFRVGLEEKTASSSRQQFANNPVAIVHCKYENFGAGKTVAYLPRGFDPVHERQGIVEDCDVRL